MIADGKEGMKIRVVVRKRPISKKEIQKSDIDIVEKRGAKGLVLKELKQKVDLTRYIEEHNFIFDNVFDENTTNKVLYTEVVQPLVLQAFKGVKITCFAYGQTGSGKTFTMMGAPNKELQIDDSSGVFLLAANDIFSLINKKKINVEVWVSFYEIYCGKLFDLLSNRNILFAREDGKQNVCIVGLSEKRVSNVPDLMSIVSFGLGERTTGITSANIDSSRSHAILQITLKMCDEPLSKISFIDLAGSERACDTIDGSRQTRLDGAEINKSLLALKECIRAIDHLHKHTPFRASKLTMVLKDSFIGICKTVMVANISPVLSCCEHTLNTLRYADRVKELKKDGGIQNEASISEYDQLSSQLLLPRQAANTKKIAIKSSKSPQPALKNNFLTKQAIIKKVDSTGGVSISPNIHEQRLTDHAKMLNKFLLSKKSDSQPPKLKEGQQGEDDIVQTSIHNVIKKNHEDNKKNEDGQKQLELQIISTEHQKLVEQILEEEELLIGSHKTHIDDLMELAKQEMAYLQNVSKQGADIDIYVNNLESLMIKKMESIKLLKGRLRDFRTHLRQEQDLSKKFYEMQSKVGHS